VVSDAADAVDAIQAATNLAAAAAVLLGSWIALPAAGVIAFAETAFNIFYEVAGALLVDVWDEQFTENLICILKANAIETDGVIKFNFFEVNQAILSQIWATQEYVVLVSQVIYLTYIIGPQGLNLAGTTTALSGDCDHCGEWCFKWEGEYLTSGADWTITHGEVYDGTEIGHVYAPFDGANRRIRLDMANLDTSQCVITSLRASIWAPSGGANTKYLDLSVIPGFDNGWYEMFIWSNAGYVHHTGLEETDVSTTNETDLWFDMIANDNTAWRLLGLMVTGTGVCPWGASNC